MPNADATLELPARPEQFAADQTAIWRAPLPLITYDPLPPERFPAYLDRRVYQGSSGRVYPLPFHHRISAEPRLRHWDAIHVENPWLRVVVLPELGGRIHVLQDRTSGEHLFYANPVIKPALVGLAGPWLAGGVEFNWPQHHRPATYLPTDAHLEHEPDGSVVVRCSDHDPFSRMKGMHAIRLHPDRAELEVEVRLFNRSEQTQSFLWWANVAARAHDDYQSFFPRDVTVVGDHANRAVTAFPRADRHYYGIDYPARAEQRYRAPDGADVTGDRLDWYRNIPVPTSYMCLGSDQDFFGGYDHGTNVGFVHVADHQIAVGKKQWTWGNSRFGHTWETNLNDDGAHYVELMAGVFTHNQPDFSYLAPGETKVFTQRWYPIREVGPVDCATREAAVRLSRDGDTARIGLVSTMVRTGAVLTLRAGDVTVLSQQVDLDPGHAEQVTAVLPRGSGAVTVSLRHDGQCLVSWTEPPEQLPTSHHQPAAEPPAAGEVTSADELALIAEHLELYRHATRSATTYWQQALTLDRDHVASLLGLARRAHLAGRHDRALELLQRALARLSQWHPNLGDTTVWYLMGSVYQARGEHELAYDSYGRASWTRQWRGAAGYAMARLDASGGRHRQALHRLADVARTEPEHLQALALTVICHRRLGADSVAADVLRRARKLDPLDAWLRFLDGRPPSADPQTCLDVALELTQCGEHQAALSCLDAAAECETERRLGQTAAGPLVEYHRAAVLSRLGRNVEAVAARKRAQHLDPTWCFPGRLADAAVLCSAVDADATDARARGLLGHWCYAVGRREDARTLWRQAVDLDPGDAVSWRNLALTTANDHGDLAEASDHYRRAISAYGPEPQLVFERDQLANRAGRLPSDRLAHLQSDPDLIAQRDDLTTEYAHLLITCDRDTDAVDVLTSRRLQPWEGGEGEVLQAWERAQVSRGVRALASGRADDAAAHLRSALDSPASLGEARHPLASTARLRLLLGDALDRTGDSAGALHQWGEAATQRGDFVDMRDREHSVNTFWSVLALRRLGDRGQADRLTADLREFRDDVAGSEPTVDYFATSLPELLLFPPDPVATRDRLVLVLDAQLALLAGEYPHAEDLLSDDQLAADRVAVDLRNVWQHVANALLQGNERTEA